MMSKLPAYFYKSTILTVDDDKLFSHALNKILSTEYFVKSFDKPELLIEYVNDHHSSFSNQHILRDCSEHDEYNTANHALVDLDIPALHQLQQTPLRHEQISIIIADYHMPNLNGVEVCSQLRTSSAKKILLTGATDQQIAIDAFNNNLIDKFIRKDSSSIADEILNYTRILTK